MALMQSIPLEFVLAGVLFVVYMAFGLALYMIDEDILN